MNRQTFREALVLIAAAVVLGFAYTMVTKQGFFAEHKSKRSQVSGLEIISLERAKALFTADSALFIDSRHQFDFSQGHIHGAINIALNEFDQHRSRLNGISKDKLLVVYCDGAECNSSLELAIKITEIGFTNVQVFFDGWKEWKAKGLPVVK